MPNNKVDTPSSFWGIGGIALTLLSFVAAAVLIASFGFVIAGAITCGAGVAIGLTCMGIGIAKNSSAIKDITTTQNVSNVNNIPVHNGYAAEKQQTKEKTEQKSKNNEIDSSEADISKKTINNQTKNQLLK